MICFYALVMVLGIIGNVVVIIVLTASFKDKFYSFKTQLNGSQIEINIVWYFISFCLLYSHMENLIKKKDILSKPSALYVIHMGKRVSLLTRRKYNQLKCHTGRKLWPICFFCSIYPWQWAFIIGITLGLANSFVWLAVG